MSDKPRVVAVIPSRMAATRLPGKPLRKIAGKPMLLHVVERVRQAEGVDAVLVATEDQEIVDLCQSEAIDVVNTGPADNGTDRVARATAELDADVVINVQGDEPLISPDTVAAVVKPFLDDPSIEMTTASRRFFKDEDPADPNFVKVVTNLGGRAMYFSRALIPTSKPGGVLPRLHLGIYGFRSDILQAVAHLPATPLQQTENLEQLRALENGIEILVVDVHEHGFGVDTEDDLARVEKILSKD